MLASSPDAQTAGGLLPGDDDEESSHPKDPIADENDQPWAARPKQR